MRRFIRILLVSLAVAIFIGPAIVTLPLCLAGGFTGIAIWLLTYPVGVAAGAPHSVTLGFLYAAICGYLIPGWLPLEESSAQALGARR